MRRAARKDRNHAEVVKQFRKFGCSILDISQLHKCADLVVSKNYKTVIVEVKDGEKPESERQLTPGEEKFSDTWQGVYIIVENLSDVIAVVKGLEK